jgi:glucosylceramidase
MESCDYTAEEERDFIKLSWANDGQSEMTDKIIAWDHNRDLIYQHE